MIPPIAGVPLFYSWEYDFDKVGGAPTNFFVNIKVPKDALNIIIFRQNIIPPTGPGSSILYGEEGFPGLYGSENAASYFNNGGVQQLAVSTGNTFLFSIINAPLLSGKFKLFMFFANMKSNG